MKGLMRLFGVYLLSAGFASAHAGGFVKFDFIEGESEVEGYEGWSEFISVVQKIAPSEVTRGVVTQAGAIPEFQQLSIIKPLDKASVEIAELALKGKTIDPVQIEWTRNINGTEKPYYKYKLQYANVTEYTSKGFGDTDLESATDDPVKEQIVLDFEKITVTYVQYDDEGNESGKVEYTWEIQ
jgi:type VI secretion system Hcp family effector